jgi:uncharacterized membrane protein YfcA
VPRAAGSVPTYVGIGIAAGFFGGLFGVGGGIIVVPLLIALAGFTSKEATATSLAAIGYTALFGALVFGLLGHVVWRDAVLVGLPAMVGAVAGIALQARVSTRGLTYLFALFLVAVAVRLALE